jgi:hypothetical protein
MVPRSSLRKGRTHRFVGSRHGMRGGRRARAVGSVADARACRRALRHVRTARRALRSKDPVLGCREETGWKSSAKAAAVRRERAPRWTARSRADFSRDATGRLTALRAGGPLPEGPATRRLAPGMVPCPALRTARRGAPRCIQPVGRSWLRALRDPLDRRPGAWAGIGFRCPPGRGLVRGRKDHQMSCSHQCLFTGGDPR